MIYENIEQAKRIKEEINTLEEEIKHIESVCESERFSIRCLMRRVLKQQPKERTYKGLWSSHDIDSIESIVVINEREAMAVVEVKKQEIEELKKQIEEL